jgi:hypothetical protein
MSASGNNLTSHHTRHRLANNPFNILAMPLILIYVLWALGVGHLDSSQVVILGPRGRTKGPHFQLVGQLTEMGSPTMKTIRTQHGIAADFCYPHSEKLSLICPECGINSVRISPPEITYGEGGFRGLVVTIRCECKTLHIFSVVFRQHKGMTFLRTDVEARAG